jgi:hypothetical protein
MSNYSHNTLLLFDIALILTFLIILTTTYIVHEKIMCVIKQAHKGMSLWATKVDNFFVKLHGYKKQV